ncbi:MAG: TorF family putative porin [Gammaproteobacteria bacterium]|nr:TorF family putative porin [Gammaproteobacteria bacterium]MBU1624639.1 TorF family putative porin [Gammaproteobacteria bacterium]MBU1982483.1 TorF family putative porin [Gammaproteobacteria bacterium]
MKKNLLVAALAATFAVPAMAEDSPFSANVSITTNYVYRGISQTANKPALQGGFDYAHASGLYAGIWGSSISWLGDSGTAASAGTEFDTYLGYSGEAGDIGYDVGLLAYNYPGDYGTNLTANTTELYGSVSYMFVTAKYSRSTGNLFGVANSSGSGYLDLSASYDLEDAGISLGAHYGKQTIANSPAADYTDVSFSASKEIGGYGFSATYTKANVTGGLVDAQGNDLVKGTLILAISKSM